MNLILVTDLISLGNDDENCAQDDYYNIADATWKNMQNEIQNWVNSYNGTAIGIQPTTIKVNRNKILEALKGEILISEINCD